MFLFYVSFSATLWGHLHLQPLADAFIGKMDMYVNSVDGVNFNQFMHVNFDRNEPMILASRAPCSPAWALGKHTEKVIFPHFL